MQAWRSIGIACLMFISCAPAAMAQMRMESPDLSEGAQMQLAQAFDQCRMRGKQAGGNQAPVIRWSGAPPGTKSFAITMFDPRAGGKEFWHWILFNIPASATEWNAATDHTEAPITEGVNDYSQRGYSGPCPPRGATYRFIFNVWALDVPQLDLAPEVTGAQLKPRLQMHVLGKATLTARYEN